MPVSCSWKTRVSSLFDKGCGREKRALTEKVHATALYCVFAQVRESVFLGDVIHRPWLTVNKTVELDS